jgi:hypothetical protein
MTDLGNRLAGANSTCDGNDTYSPNAFVPNLYKLICYISDTAAFGGAIGLLRLEALLKVLVGGSGLVCYPTPGLTTTRFCVKIMQHIPPGH